MMDNTRFYILSIITAIAIVCFLPRFTYADDWEFETGLKYNVILQKSGYFEEDTFSSVTEYLYYFAPEFERDLWKGDITTGAYIGVGSKTLRGQLESKYKYKSSTIKWEMRDKLEGRLYHTSGESDKTYAKNYAKSYLRLFLADYTIGNKVSLETKRYQEIQDYRYNYNLAKIDLEFAKEIGDGSEFEIGYQYGARVVPDSTEAGYNKHVGKLYWESWWGLGNYLTLNFELEGQDYLSPGEEDDYTSIYGIYSGTYYLGIITSLYSEYEFEQRNYERESFVHSNYYIHSVDIGPQFQISSAFRLGFNPQLTYSHSDSTTFGDAYTDFGVEFLVDYMKHKNIWINLVVKPGYRWYDIEDDIYELYSNYFFNEAMLLFDWWFYKDFRLNITATYYPEYHENDEDDMITSYISAKVEYEF